MANVYCWSCKKSLHVTTDMYDPDLPLTGDMLKAKEIVRDNKWWTFPETRTTKAGMIECPYCGSLYLKNGKLKTDADIVKRPRKIPDEYNSIILNMTEKGHSPTEIAEKFNFTRQAVGRRIYDIRKKEADE